MKSIQRESFYKEIDYLTRRKGAPPIYVSQFNLFLDEKNLRCRARIGNASLSESCKMPLLLPSRSLYSELVMDDCHRKVLHNVTRETLNLARQKYWVLRGREMARKIVRHCVLCKRIEGLFYKSTYCPDLPSIRVDDGPPFSNVGIDFAGPLFVKGQNALMNKCYVC